MWSEPQNKPGTEQTSLSFSSYESPEDSPDPVITPDANTNDNPIVISVEQAVLLTLKNNHELKIQQHQPTITASFEEIERGQFDTELFAEADYAEQETIETSRSTENQFSVFDTNSSEAVGIRQYLPTGTALEALIEHQRSTSNRTPEQQEARLGLTLTQSLLQGFGPAVNLATVRQAELDTLASRTELKGFTEVLLAETEIAYWEYVLAEKEIEIFIKSLEVARQQLQEIQIRIDVGILPEIEAAAAKVEESLRIQAMIEARSQLEEKRLRLLRLLNPNTSKRFNNQVVVTSSPEIDLQPIIDTKDRIQLASQMRPDLNEARIRLKQNRLETVITKNGLLPRLELFITLGKTGFADSFSDSFKELDGDTYDFEIGFQLSHYLNNRVAKAQDLVTLSEREQAIEAVKNLEQLVELDVLLAINEVERVRQQIDASRVTRTFQEKTMTAEKERFDVGASTSLDVALAQRDLLRSQITEIESIVNYRIALVKLHLAEGSLLERRGIKAESPRVAMTY
jgi:outer membrane protein TolC